MVSTWARWLDGLERTHDVFPGRPRPCNPNAFVEKTKASPFSSYPIRHPLVAAGPVPAKWRKPQSQQEFLSAGTTSRHISKAGVDSTPASQLALMLDRLLETPRLSLRFGFRLGSVRLDVTLDFARAGRA